MVWQDIVISIANIVFLVALIPQIIDGFKKKKGLINPWASSLTILALFSLCVTYFSLDLIYSCGICFSNALLWIILLIQRIIYKN